MEGVLQEAGTHRICFFLIGGSVMLIVLIFCTLFLLLVFLLCLVWTILPVSIRNYPIGFLKRLFNKVDLHPCQGGHDKVYVLNIQ